MINASRYYGLWLALFGVGCIAACSSSGGGGGDDGGNNNPKAGSSTGGSGLQVGGTPGKGGSGTAGSSTGGTGTSGSATGGSATGGSGGASSTACAGMKPASNLVTDFADLAPNATNAGQFTFMAGVPGGTFSYQPAEITVTNASGALNAKGTVMNYDGFGVYFTACTDASAYTGVSFNIKGNAGPTGKLSFRFQSNANTAVDTVNKKGSCMVPAGTVDPYPLCHDAIFDITVTEGGGEVAVKFSDVMGGVPVATVDGKDIVGLQWAFAWAGATDTMYPVDVTVDDIKFTGGPAGGGGGAGGSGGGGAGGGGAGGAQ